MADTRLQRLAQVLARYPLGIKPGDRLAIQSGPIATSLVRDDFCQGACGLTRWYLCMR
jgi:leucyl aminopeptidase (aminopeptidase T)